MIQINSLRAVLLVCAAAVTAAGCAWETPRAPATGPAAVTHQDGGKGVMTRGTDVAARAALTARAQVGVPYLWGGRGPDGFDCSGLIHYAYAQHRVAVPRTSAGQRRVSRAVPLGDARPGDLLFFTTGAKSGHVGMYLGDGRFVHAPSSGKSVTIADLGRGYYRRQLQFVGRLPGQPE